MSKSNLIAMRRRIYLCVFLLAVVEVTIITGCPSMLCSCDHTDILDCSNRRLEKIPSWDDDENEASSNKNYKQLNLNSNEIFSVPPSAFSGLDVESIDLSSNQLVGISPKAFRDVHDTLEELNLSNVGLRVLHWATFNTLHQLQTLILSHNEFFAIPPGLFESLGSLETLDLSHNEIASLKEGSLRGLRSLLQLNLQDNKITSIDEGSFADSRHLTSLNLNSNQMLFLNQSTFQGLEHLRNLEINDNNISRIEDGAFVLLPYLQHLSLRRNNISTIGPKTLQGLENLQELFLDENVIRTISDKAFTGTTRLHTLHLQHNYLSTLGQGFNIPVGLSSLEKLALENNPLDCSCAISWISVLSARKADIVGNCHSPKKYEGQEVNKIDFSSCKVTTTTVPTLGIVHPTINTGKYHGTGGYANEVGEP